jgi:hypothetical protein
LNSLTNSSLALAVSAASTSLSRLPLCGNTSSKRYGCFSWPGAATQSQREDQAQTRTIVVQHHGTHRYAKFELEQRNRRVPRVELWARKDDQIIAEEDSHETVAAWALQVMEAILSEKLPSRSKQVQLRVQLVQPVPQIGQLGGDLSLPTSFFDASNDS